jgi:hypothetical protein
MDPQGTDYENPSTGVSKSKWVEGCGGLEISKNRGGNIIGRDKRKKKG